MGVAATMVSRNGEILLQPRAAALWDPQGTGCVGVYMCAVLAALDLSGGVSSQVSVVASLEGK